MSVPDRLVAALASRYRVERKIGAGGMATVYLARDLKHDRQVAVKVLRSELAAGDGAERFVREIRLAARLSHQNIVALFDSGTADDLMYYVMPFVDEPTLRERIDREGPMRLDEAVRLAKEIADALQYAHTQGVIHRDIKPENILIWRGHALIADFGIGKAFGSAGEPRTTVTGLVLGTPAYMSPEQGAGTAVIDQRTDIYSLGSVLYEMLSGQPPFSGPSVFAIMAKHAAEPRPSVRAVRPDVPEALDQVLQKAMAVDLSDRYASCAALSAALSSPLPNVPRARSIARQAAWLLPAAILLLVALLSRRDGGGTPKAPTYPDDPQPGAWVAQSGETYSVVASSDSLLLVHRSQSRDLHAFDGAQWVSWAIPESFELRPYSGTLPRDRLLATRRDRSADGKSSAQLWWLELTPRGVRPGEPVGDAETEETQPYWWSDGTTLVTWLETARRRTATGWMTEATGAPASIVTMWGRDANHRFAIAKAPNDSVLVHDGIGWQKQGLPVDPRAGRPEFAGGALLGDGASVVFGQRCLDDENCAPLVIHQAVGDSAWRPLEITAGAGLRSRQPRKRRGVCVTRFDVTGAAGRSVADYYVWGEWTYCRPEVAWREDTGCAASHPCVWHVVNGELRVPRELLGKVIAQITLVGNAFHAVVSDGTLWRDTASTWRPISQVPELPVRLVAASPRMVLMSHGSRVSWQPPGSAVGRFYVKPLTGIPTSVSERAPLRRLVVRDSTIALLTATGDVFTTLCAGSAPTDAAAAQVTCQPLRSRGAGSGRLDDMNLLPDGTVIGIAREGYAVSSTATGWRREPLPELAQTDSLWRVQLSAAGDAIAVGTRVVIRRRPTGQWEALGSPRVGSERARGLVVWPPRGIVVADGGVRAWEDVSTAAPAAEWQPRVSGEGQVSALHRLPDGRLVAGVEHLGEPGVGGWLLIWDRPTSDAQASRVKLPLNVDVTDIADDGSYLYVVGRGGRMAIPLDSLARYAVKSR